MLKLFGTPLDSPARPYPEAIRFLCFFDIKKVVNRFMQLGGEALSCGTCLRMRKMNASEVCPLSTMDTLVTLTEEADRVVSFG